MSSEHETRNGEPIEAPSDFIRDIVREDLDSGKHAQVHTRFPPEPNGFLHIGHAKAICINFGIAEQYGGLCNLRFDDTNPEKESDEFVRAIQEDVRWLGFDWDDRLFFASGYFERLYELACHLIRRGQAYVDSLSAEQIREYRGTPTEPGRNSPYRERSVEENLDLFQRMRAGEFEEGSHVLRAKIDMTSGNLNLRDPTLYRIRKVTHHRTGDAWCIYPMYDFTHPLSDALEGITHSLCTLEFEAHRPLYDWVVRETEIQPQPRQIEFAPLKLAYTVVSKRNLRKLIDDGIVDGWDDPRMPTLRGMRRRGYTSASIREFIARLGVAKRDGLVDLAQLEFAVRQDLNAVAPRLMGVLDPIKVVIENYPEDRIEQLEAINNPEDPSYGTRNVPFCRELYIERADFMEEPPRKFFRLGPGREVRLRAAYYITCTDVIKNDAGEVVELRCSYDPESLGGTADGRKVKGTLHWVSARHALDATVRLYDRLFTREEPLRLAEGESLADALNPDSLTILSGCKVEPAMAEATPGRPYQLERQGYFTPDLHDSSPEALVLNRTVTLRDTWAKVARKQG